MKGEYVNTAHGPQNPRDGPVKKSYLGCITTPLLTIYILCINWYIIDNMDIHIFYFCKTTDEISSFDGHASEVNTLIHFKTYMTHKHSSSL